MEVSGGRNAISGSGYQGTPDWVYQAPAAVSVISREAIENSPTRNARDLLDNVAGVYANRSEAQNPGISVNIRGLQDQDRIANMIDGARQSFQRSAHGATQRTYIDTAFIRAIDIEKSTTSGVGSAGALGGSVNYRTLLAEDLIAPGKQYGGQVNLTTGTNQFNFDGSTAAAVRLSDRFSVLGGISYKNIGAYDIGKNGTINSAATYAGDVLLFSGQEVRSSILKAEGQVTEDVKVTLGWLRNNSRFNTGNYDFAGSQGNLQKATEGVVNNTYTSALDWKPDSELIDLKARFYYNNIRNNKVRGRFDPVDGAVELRHGDARRQRREHQPLRHASGSSRSQLRHGSLQRRRQDRSHAWLCSRRRHRLLEHTFGRHTERQARDHQWFRQRQISRPPIG